MTNEFGPETAMAMARMAAWLDFSKFGRVVPKSNEPVNVLLHRSHVEGNGERDDNVIYAAEFKTEQWREQINSAFDFLSRSDVDDLPCGRDAVLSLQSLLSSEYGAEGCKRFCEQSYLTFEMADDELNLIGDNLSMSDFWADFRTFLDVDRATSIGHPFKIEHFLGTYFVINDSKGARIEHHGGAAIDVAALRQMARAQRGDL